MENSFTEMTPYQGETGLAVRQPMLPSVSAGAEQARAVAEVQAALTIAQARPRDEIRSRDRLLQACQRASLASTAVYQYPRGGQKVTGPSIRLANAAARSWGNMDYGFRELDRRDGESEVEAFAWDLETNTRATRRFVVKHRRDTKGGGYDLKDERDIYELTANMAQRRVRACILEIIPGDIIEEAVGVCEGTMRAALPEGKSLGDVIKGLIDAFSGLGVSRQAVEKRLGHKLTPDATQAGEILNMRKIYRSIVDGFSTPDDWFEMDEAKRMDDLDKRLAGDKEPEAEEPADPAADPPANAATPARKRPTKAEMQAKRDEAAKGWTETTGLPVSKAEEAIGKNMDQWVTADCQRVIRLGLDIQEENKGSAESSEGSELVEEVTNIGITCPVTGVLQNIAKCEDCAERGTCAAYQAQAM